MSTCVPPVTSSPGHLVLQYAHTTQSLRHVMQVRWKYNVDIYNIAARLADAQALSNIIKSCQSPAFTIDGWAIKDNTGRVIHSASFPVPYVGTHTPAGNVADLRSRTVTIVGEGTPNPPGSCFGKAFLRFHTGATYDFVPGMKFIQPNADIPLDTLRAYLDQAAAVWADFYGQAAICKGPMPVQFNAHTQRKDGS